MDGEMLKGRTERDRKDSVVKRRTSKGGQC